MNWRWPAKPDNDLMPLYELVWRLLWVVPFYVGRAITWVSIAAVEGASEANTWWREQTWG